MTKQNLQDKSSSELLFTAKDIAGDNVPCFFKNIQGDNVPYKIYVPYKMK